MATRPLHQPRFLATCTHMTMVRVYSYILRCDSCGNCGPFGWLYCCSQDSEEILRDSIASGNEVAFDDLGKQLVAAVQSRERGPEKRAENAASFLEEMPTTYISKTYTSAQLLIIFNQRKHLGDVLRRESVRKNANTVKESSTSDLGEYLDQTSKPWVPSRKEECQYKICPYCRPAGADRSYISMDGVAEGDIPATAAAGYGFHLFGQRPICCPKLVSNLGKRLLSTSAAASSTTSTTSTTSSSSEDYDGSQDNTETRLAAQMALQLGLSLDQDPTLISPQPAQQLHLPRSPGSPNLAAQAGHRQSVDGDTSIQDSTDASITLPSAAGIDLGKEATEMEEHENEEGRFSTKPLEVQNGVAVLEESVEMHVPDVVTQS